MNVYTRNVLHKCQLSELLIPTAHLHHEICGTRLRCRSHYPAAFIKTLKDDQLRKNYILYLTYQYSSIITDLRVTR